jgi:hypothetical protein
MKPSAKVIQVVTEKDGKINSQTIDGGSLSGNRSDCGILGCDIIKTFRRKIIPPSSGSTDIPN